MRFLILVTVSAFAVVTHVAAQTPTDAEVAAKWEICRPHEIQGRLAKDHPWQNGWGSEPGGANCGAVRDAYGATPAARAARDAEAKEAFDRASVRELTKSLK